MSGQQPEQFHERRKGMRTRFVTRVFLTLPEEQEQLEGDLQDISLFGMYVGTRRQVAIASVCSIRIVITAENSRLILDDLQGQVVRQDEQGLGIRFAARLEWYVLFNIYTHFGKGRRVQNAVVQAEQPDVEAN
ncbi:PilZ domain-containing protein [Desulfoprunum benzoelyticum]|jgi:hypothetical protein|uniref:PilZ domain-containing protein n=1 Tax=Desulfoprunum benzoelyticum TaxID=1506996 RepID=A0A840UL21_9BACT|nr:PilZ domain-containing protein [Desulfoprunum benzoelyticum]MBB5346335.1 hypothetical protein [Desulfoprunum benzoelyticum]MBM9528666.1 PilZ domain-containing protein [Desulfoprunum benzoelyticum]